VQDLAEVIGDVGNAAVGYDLKLMVRIEVGGSAKNPPDEVVGMINAKLGAASKDLRILADPAT
jgi:hypothetical protein